MVVLRESGELESDEPIEQSSFEELNCSYSSPPTPYSPQWGPANFPDFPPSPTYSPLWGPTSFPPSSPTYSPLWGPTSFPPSPPSSSTLSLFGVRTGIDLSEGFVGEPLTLFVDYLIRERGGELNVINGLKGGTLNVINGVNTLNALEFEGRKVLGIDDAYEDYVVKDDSNVEHEDIIDQLVVDCEGVDHRVMGDRGGKLCTISARRVFKINGVEYRQGRISSATSEPSAEFQAKLSARVWLGDRGQWVVDVRHGWNWLNLGIFRTTEGASSGEERARRRGGKDLFDYPRPLLFENGLEPLQLPPTSQEENQDGGIGCEGTGDCAMVDQAQFNSGCLKKRKTREKNPGGERRNKKAKGVRIEIPLDDILQRNGMCIKDAAIDLKVSKSTLKRICRGYDIYRWPPRKEQELISQSRPNKSPAVVDQEQIPQLNPDTLLPSNQVLPTSDTYSLKVKVKCEEGTIIKFRLSSPWRKIELEQEVKKRLPFEAGTYDIKYKDEIDELILICCDEDLAECISSSSLVDNCSIELFLNLKPK